MMGVTKFQQFINRLSGGGLTAVQAEALLTPEVAGAFADALTWSSTRKQLQRSPAFIETLANSETLLGLFLQDKGLWAGLVEFPLSAQAVATNTRALDQIQQHPWAWEKALLREYFYSSLLEDTAMLAHLTPTSIVKDTLLWPLAYSNIVSRNWLLADDAQAIPIFDDSAAWSKVRNVGLTMNTFCKNTPALTHALDTNPARLRNGIESIRAAAFNQTQVAPLVRTHPNRDQAVAFQDGLVRKQLARKHHRPFKMTAMSSNANDQYLYAINAQGDVLWEVPFESIESTITLPDNTGFVVEKLVPAVKNQSSKKVVFERYDWPSSGDGPAVKAWRVETSLTNRTSYLPMISPNGQYLVAILGNRVFVYDMVNQTVHCDEDKNSQLYSTARTYCVFDDGRVAVGYTGGLVTIHDKTMATLKTAQTYGGVSKYVQTLGVTSAGELVIGYSSYSDLVVVNMSTYTQTRTITLNSANSSIVHGGFLRRPDGGFYVASSNSPYIQSFNSSESFLGQQTSAAYSISSRRGFFVDNWNHLWLVYSQYNESRVSVDGSGVSTSKPHKVTDSFHYVGHPRHPHAVMDPMGGVTAYNSSDVQIESTYVPISYLEKNQILQGLTYFLGEHWVVQTAVHFHLYDQETGVLVGGYPNPSDPDASTNMSRKAMQGVYASKATKLTASHERVHTAYTGSSGEKIMVYSKDGIRTASIDRTDSGGNAHDITLLPDNTVLLAADTYRAIYNAATGALVDQQSLGASMVRRILAAWSNQVFFLPQYNTTYGSYVYGVQRNGSNQEYVGTSANFFRPQSNYSVMSGAVFADGYLVAIIRHQSSHVKGIYIAQYNDTTGQFTGTEHILSDTWLDSNGLSGVTLGLAYNPSDDRLYVISHSSGGELYSIRNWKYGEASAIVTNLGAPAELTGLDNAHLDGNYPRAELGDW